MCMWIPLDSRKRVTQVAATTRGRNACAGVVQRGCVPFEPPPGGAVHTFVYGGAHWAPPWTCLARAGDKGVCRRRVLAAPDRHRAHLGEQFRTKLAAPVRAGCGSLQEVRGSLGA